MSEWSGYMLRSENRCFKQKGGGGFHEAGFVDEIEEDVELVFETVEEWEVHRGEGGWSAVKSPKQKTLKEEENPWTKDKL